MHVEQLILENSVKNHYAVGCLLPKRPNMTINLLGICSGNAVIKNGEL